MAMAQAEDKGTCIVIGELILLFPHRVRTEWRTDPGATGGHLVISGDHP